MSEALDLAKALISRNSVTPEDAGCQDLVAHRLVPMGFAAVRADRNGTANLWLRRGRVRPLFVFAGHTDVVPSGPPDQWTSDPFVAAERDGLLYGRGSADMKSSIAAFVTAAEGFVRAHPAHAGSIALLLTSDEEGPATDGTVAVVEALAARGEAVDYALVGEPTSVSQLGDTIKNGRRGSLSGNLRVIGVQGHVAYPQLARNPLHELAPALTELAQTVWDQGDPDFPPTTFQVSNLHAGTGALNVIPGHCEMQFNLRYAAATRPADLQRRIEGILARHGLRYALSWTLGAEPYLTPRGALVEAASRAIEEATGRKPQLSTTGGTSDARFLARICPQVVEFGPLNATIHQIDECIPAPDVERLSGIYGRVLQLLLAPAPGPVEAMASAPHAHLRTVRDALRYAVTRLNREAVFFGHGQLDAYDEAAFLVLRALSLPLERLEVFLDAAVSQSELDALAALIERRVTERTPAPYLIGEAWLQGYRFQVDPRVLIPRSFIAELLKDGLSPWLLDSASVGSVLDLCTGSGCLAIIAADIFGQARVDAIDLSADALAVAARNVADYALAERVRLIESDLFAAVPQERYELIVCNPPYVTDLAVSRLPREYLHEPSIALAGGRDGLEVVRRVVAAARGHLTPDGLLVVEVGDGREAMERAYPELDLTWASTSGGDDLVFIARAQDLP